MFYTCPGCGAEITELGYTCELTQTGYEYGSLELESGNMEWLEDRVDDAERENYTYQCLACEATVDKDAVLATAHAESRVATTGGPSPALEIIRPSQLESVGIINNPELKDVTPHRLLICQKCHHQEVQLKNEGLHWTPPQHLDNADTKIIDAAVIDPEELDDSGLECPHCLTRRTRKNCVIQDY
jgi:DNA-directed RNA polymerase subunit RPC12/RpoP